MTPPEIPPDTSAQPSARTTPIAAEEVAALFTRADGGYLCARWGRPLAPVVFGAAEATLATVKGALEAVAALAGHDIAETDPELGANLMIFFLRDWAELGELPDLDRLIPGLDALLPRLTAGRATQYRAFRFDAAGAIKAAFVFLRIADGMEEVPAEELALAQAAQVMLTWSEGAFATRSPLARLGETVILRPEIAGLIRAAYAPAMPVAATDPAHALRLVARLEAGGVAR